MIQIQILEHHDIIEPTDWCRPLILTPSQHDSEMYFFDSMYSGAPTNNVRWVQVYRVLGECWYGKTVKELVSNIEYEYEFARGNIPQTHQLALTKSEYTRTIFNKHLRTHRVSFGKHNGKTALEIQNTDPSYFAWAVNKGILKSCNVERCYLDYLEKFYGI